MAHPITYNGKQIRKNPFGWWEVHGFVAWGDQIGEDRHTFTTLKAAKAFIDRMTKNNEQ